jgi:hypothetical protein
LFITNRYAVGFDSKRGFLGSTIILLGRGFEKEDYAQIVNIPCKTTFVSQNALSFLVPALNQCGKHHAKLVSDNGDIRLGFFKQTMSRYTLIYAVLIWNLEKNRY